MTSIGRHLQQSEVCDLHSEISTLQFGVHQEFLEIPRRRRFASHRLTGDWMAERNAPGVERLPWKLAQHAGELDIVDFRPERFSIFGIADNRPSARRQVDAYLMRAPGQETAAE